MTNIIQHTSTTAPKRFQCRHIHTEGRRCGSASLRGEEFCYFHHNSRKPVSNPRTRRSRQATFDLPLPEDRGAIQISIGEVLRRIASNAIDPRAPAYSSTASRSPRSTSPNPRPSRPSREAWSKRPSPTPPTAPSPPPPNSPTPTHPAPTASSAASSTSFAEAASSMHKPPPPNLSLPARSRNLLSVPPNLSFRAKSRNLRLPPPNPSLSPTSPPPPKPPSLGVIPSEVEGPAVGVPTLIAKAGGKNRHPPSQKRKQKGPQHPP